ncbi:ribosome biogenesis GTPase YlqF [Halobacillus halophilus]|uniref:Ribosome biogenesis GTPase A n=1 Tax=Halobacillus halophilus (strain ATCC 35676 / DSM 2266 / JCM 20832 / KCTC 3685 / LMG 17431 / NBRC 102448 / NCIMB 2269) TaxID=866895 RepID=I0JMJ4_HALH3|nr:ribosome biogenesis GTPase YlqF [Halobacillus halophilus]ASF39446.1 ribosome biogenesis GTPase YlqF [Halobacillus halophilus]CCG45364.1 ribosomal biogenesis GTPase [Halobacillus halophilus DSM 2266]
MTIQWYPGHMAKAKREASENLKLVDFVIELVDARAPLSSQNPMLQGILGDKPKMMVLMKKDLADPKVTKEWLEHFKENGFPSIAIEANNKQDIQAVINLGKSIGNEKIEKLKAKGVRPRASRAMILGIPNVGKSTLINRLANKSIAKTGDKPGVTKKQQWIKVKNEFDLLDTPGILWPKFEEEEVGYRLASIGTIKDQILPTEDVAAYVLDYLQAYYPSMLEERYGFEGYDDIMTAFETIGKKRGCLESGGRINFDKVSDVIIQDLRNGKLGLISFESPE